MKVQKLKRLKQMNSLLRQEGATCHDQPNEYSGSDSGDSESDKDRQARRRLGGGGGSWGSDEPPTRCRDPPSKDRQLICGASAWLSLWSDVSGDSLET